jgi:hypothetical protein
MKKKKEMKINKTKMPKKMMKKMLSQLKRQKAVLFPKSLNVNNNEN